MNKEFLTKLNKTNNDTSVHPAQKGLKSVIIGALSNLVLCVIKGIAGILGNSGALVADAIESLSDVATSFIVWAGLKIATKEPDINHPYGHGKAEPIAALMVSIALFIAAIVITVQSIQNILTPHEIPHGFTLIVLVGVIVIKEVLFRRIHKTGAETGSLAVKSDAWHHRSDAITSAGTFIGIAISILAGPGYEAADDWAAILTSVIIVINAYRNGKPAIEEIMDVALPEEEIEKIKKVAMTVAGVMAIDKCYARKTGFDYYIDIHVVVDGTLPVYVGHDIAHKVQDKLNSFNPMIKGVAVHIEPFDPNYEKLQN